VTSYQAYVQAKGGGDKIEENKYRKKRRIEFRKITYRIKAHQK